MTVYAYSKVAVYAELGGSLRLARSTRSFVTDAVTGLPVDVTQGARVAPYLDTDAAGIADFTAAHPGPLRLTTGTVFVDVYSEELPGIALAAVTAAEAAQAAAEAAVAAATGPADATVAGLIPAASATQAAGDTRWLQTAASLGLGSVDNTADTAKPVSTATAASIAAQWENYEAAAAFAPVWALFSGRPGGLRVSRTGLSYILWQGLGLGRWVSWGLPSLVTAPGGYATNRLSGCRLHGAMISVDNDDAGVTKTGTWTSAVQAAAYGGDYRWNATSGNTASWTSPASSTSVGVRVVRTTNGGLAKVTIGGSATAATLLPTAGDLAASGAYPTGILVANGGTLAPTDRVLDCYGPIPVQYDARVGMAEGLTAGAQAVVLTATGYAPTALTGGRTYLTGFSSAVASTTLASSGSPELFEWYALNSDINSAWEFAIERQPTGASVTTWVGSIHGYETQTGLTLMVDGVITAIADGQTITATSEIELVRTSQGLHPDTGATVHENFTTTYRVDRHGLRVSPVVEMLTARTITKAYSMMALNGSTVAVGVAMNRANLLNGATVLVLPGTSDQMLGASKSAASWAWNAAGKVGAAMYVPDVAGFTDGWAHPGGIYHSVQDRDGTITKMYVTWIVDAAGVAVPAGTIKRWTTRHAVGHFPAGADATLSIA